MMKENSGTGGVGVKEVVDKTVYLRSWLWGSM